METEKLREALIKIAFDKGLIALLLLLAGWLTSRSIEKLKSSLSWGAEVLKQKQSYAIAAMKALRELSDSHLQLTGDLVVFRAVPKEVFARFSDASKAVERSAEEARLLFTKETTAAIWAAKDASWNIVAGPASNTLKEISPSIKQSENGDLQQTELPIVARVVMDTELAIVKEKIGVAVCKLQREFPEQVTW